MNSSSISLSSSPSNQEDEQERKISSNNSSNQPSNHSNGSESFLTSSSEFPLQSPVKKPVDLNARTFNLLLENIFLLSLRKDAGPPLKSIESGDETLLNSRNLNDVVIMYLLSGEEAAGAIVYLIGCYRRLLQKETTVSEKIKEEFNRYILVDCLSYKKTIFHFNILLFSLTHCIYTFRCKKQISVKLFVLGNINALLQSQRSVRFAYSRLSSVTPILRLAT